MIWQRKIALFHRLLFHTGPHIGPVGLFPVQPIGYVVHHSGKVLCRTIPAVILQTNVPDHVKILDVTEQAEHCAR
jgi:hypothetical protein